MIEQEGDRVSQTVEKRVTETYFLSSFHALADPNDAYCALAVNSFHQGEKRHLSPPLFKYINSKQAFMKVHFFQPPFFTFQVFHLSAEPKSFIPHCGILCCWHAFSSSMLSIKTAVRSKTPFLSSFDLPLRRRIEREPR